MSTRSIVALAYACSFVGKTLGGTACLSGVEFEVRFASLTSSHPSRRIGGLGALANHRRVDYLVRLGHVFCRNYCRIERNYQSSLSLSCFLFLSLNACDFRLQQLKSEI